VEAKKVGKRIKAIRKDQGLTQTEFGSQIGVKGNTVTGYENGTRCPSDAVINSICLKLGYGQEKGQCICPHPILRIHFKDCFQI